MADTINTNTNAFAQDSFKAELQQKACEVQESESYAREQHKSVAQDAAIMAASKSDEFAKVAEAGFVIEDKPEGVVEVAKEKIGEGMDMAREGLNTAGQSITGAAESVKEGTGQAYTSTVGTLSGAMETVREKIGEGLEFVAEKMAEAGAALTEKSEDTKSQGVSMQKQAELNQAKINLKPAGN